MKIGVSHFGRNARDIVTGFTGILYGRTEYMSGCTQVLLLPQGVTAEGKRKDGDWFDEQRIELVGQERIELDNGTTPGGEKTAPTK